MPDTRIIGTDTTFWAGLRFTWSYGGLNSDSVNHTENTSVPVSMGR